VLFSLRSFYDIATLPIIQARFEVDRSAIARKIMPLLVPTYFPRKKTPAAQAQRIIILGSQSQPSAIRMAWFLPEFAGLKESTLWYLLRRCEACAVFLLSLEIVLTSGLVGLSVLDFVDFVIEVMGEARTAGGDCGQLEAEISYDKTKSRD
jgi:hypothetical protein